MVDTRDYTGSRWLKSRDLDPNQDTVLTIIGAAVDEVRDEEADTIETLVALRFEESEKQLGLNKTNADSLFDLFDSWDTDDYCGKRIALYIDPNVTMKGKRTGGIRIRPTLPKLAKTPARRGSRSKKTGGSK